MLRVDVQHGDIDQDEVRNILRRRKDLTIRPYLLHNYRLKLHLIAKGAISLAIPGPGEVVSEPACDTVEVVCVLGLCVTSGAETVGEEVEVMALKKTQPFS